MNQLHEWNNRPVIARLFDILFLIISIATFRHTASGFASIEGNPWAGAFSAIAIDVTMYLAATALSSNLSVWGRVAVGGALLLSALASAISQLLFSITHAQVLEIAPAAAWLGWAQAVIDYRVVWMPFSLPAFALLVTAAGKAQDIESISLAAHRALQDAIQANEQELDTLDTQLADAQSSLDIQRAKAQKSAAQEAKLQAWIDQLQSFGVDTKHGVASTCAFAHNGNMPTQKAMVEATGVSLTTVRNALSDVAQVQKDNLHAEALQAVTPRGGVLRDASDAKLRYVAGNAEYHDELRAQAQLLLDTPRPELAEA